MLSKTVKIALDELYQLLEHFVEINCSTRRLMDYRELFEKAQENDSDTIHASSDNGIFKLQYLTAENVWVAIDSDPLKPQKIISITLLDIYLLLQHFAFTIDQKGELVHYRKWFDEIRKSNSDILCVTHIGTDFQICHYDSRDSTYLFPCHDSRPKNSNTEKGDDIMLVKTIKVQLEELYFLLKDFVETHDCKNKRLQEYREFFENMQEDRAVVLSIYASRDGSDFKMFYYDREMVKPTTPYFKITLGDLYLLLQHFTEIKESFNREEELLSFKKWFKELGENSDSDSLRVLMTGDDFEITDYNSHTNDTQETINKQDSIKKDDIMLTKTVKISLYCLYSFLKMFVEIDKCSISRLREYRKFFEEMQSNKYKSDTIYFDDNNGFGLIPLHGTESLPPTYLFKITLGDLYLLLEHFTYVNDPKRELKYYGKWFEKIKDSDSDSLRVLMTGDDFEITDYNSQTNTTKEITQTQQTINKQDNHYKNMPIEPIDVIRKILTKEEYIGWLKGSWLKYKLRAGFKDGTSDLDKAKVFEEWLKEVGEEAEQ